MATSKKEFPGTGVQGRPLTIERACSVLGVSQATLYRYMAKGKLAFSKEGRSRTIDEAELLRCKEDRTLWLAGDLERTRMQRRAAAHALHSLYDSRQITRAARDAFFRRFEEAVDPDMTLTDRERQRRATQAKKAYFTDLARQSSKARGRRRSVRHRR